jgi:tRNA(Ile)-lysidine synthetase-like protein
MSDDNTSIGADELEGLFGPLAGAIGGACALAVSGGSDSTALMVLFADWLRQTGADPRAHTVLTIDHGLRAESPAEARAVADRATTLGFRHAVLVWDGPKPQTGIQAAAREARYRLMGGRMAEDGVAALLVAHTRDDQAETLLMRLARGSGLDGLSAMGGDDHQPRDGHDAHCPAAAGDAEGTPAAYAGAERHRLDRGSQQLVVDIRADEVARGSGGSRRTRIVGRDVGGKRAAAAAGARGP